MMLAAELRQIGRDRLRFGLIKVPDDQRRARFRKTQRYRAAKPCAAARDNGGAATSDTSSVRLYPEKSV